MYQETLIGKIMKRERLLELGFEELPHFNIGNSLLFYLSRNRHLSFSSVGTPNETLYICEVNDEHNKIIDDAICLHNFDYDGYLTEDRLSLLLTFFAKNKLTKI